MTIQIKQDGPKTIVEMDTLGILKMAGQWIGLALAQPNSPIPHDPNTAQSWEQEMLNQHLANWQRLQTESATYVAGEKPLHLLNQIAAEEEAIRRFCSAA
ncbi:MAG: hypothetical protein AAF639_32645 [Chloroflexota bacterium]